MSKMSNVIFERVKKMFLVITFLVYIFFFIIQKYAVYPIETFFFESQITDKASVLYLPHAIRIIAFFLLGFSSVTPIFIAQCFTFIVLNNIDFMYSIILSLISTSSIVFGFYCFKSIKKFNFFSINKIDWKKLILIGFLVSIFNSFFSSIYFSNFNFQQFDILLFLRFIVGDTFGVLVGMIIFILILKIIKIWNKHELS